MIGFRAASSIPIHSAAFGASAAYPARSYDDERHSLASRRLMLLGALLRLEAIHDINMLDPGLGKESVECIFVRIHSIISRRLWRWLTRGAALRSCS